MTRIDTNTQHTSYIPVPNELHKCHKKVLSCIYRLKAIETLSKCNLKLDSDQKCLPGPFTAAWNEGHQWCLEDISLAGERF